MPKRMLFVSCKGQRREGEKRGEFRAGPRMQCQPSFPQETLGMWAKRMGGLYRTAEITNRAQDRVSPLISALAKHAKISQSLGLWSHSVCLLMASIFAVTSQVGTEPKTVSVIPTRKSLDCCSKSHSCCHTDKKDCFDASKENTGTKQLGRS